MKDNFRKWLLDIFFPAFCLGCGKEGFYCCKSCFESIEMIETADIKIQDSLFIDHIYAVSEYNNNSLLAKLIHNFKYEFIEELSEPLGRLIFDRLKKENLPIMTLNPVPLHKQRQKWRGYNQAELLCRKASYRSDYEMCQLLERWHYKIPQMELKKEERGKNVKDAFHLAKNMQEADRNRQIMLVDDVATTLSTLNECAKVLKQSGFNNVSAIVLARVS